MIYSTHRQSSFCLYKINASSGNLKWINNGYKPNSQGYGRSKMATWLFLAPWRASLLFDRIKPFLAVGLISHSGEKKMVKIHFLQSPVIREPTLLVKSSTDTAKTSWASWRPLLSLTSFVVRQGPQTKGLVSWDWTGCKIWLQSSWFFCLTCYWLLIFVFRYKETLVLKSLMV